MSSEVNPTRSRILKSAWSLLEEGGGNSVRMSDIAKAAKISRQALYLHFPNRAELLVATTRYIDEVHDIEGQLVASRTAKTGVDRLEAWIETWGNYIPTIYGIATALIAMGEEDADAAWAGRMAAVRHGCAAAIAALKADGDLTVALSEDEATDLLWALLSVETWARLCHECRWSQPRYLEVIQTSARQLLIA